jgi:Protein kinase domain
MAETVRIPRKTINALNGDVQRVVGWLAEKYEETGLWPSLASVWREIAAADLNHEVLKREGSEAFNHLGTPQDEKEVVRLRPWVLYDTGKCREAFDRAYEVCCDIQVLLRKTESVTVTRKDLSQRYHLAFNSKQLHQLVWVLSCAFGASTAFDEKSIETDWTHTFPVSFLKNPMPSLEELFLSRPTTYVHEPAGIPELNNSSTTAQKADGDNRHGDWICGIRIGAGGQGIAYHAKNERTGPVGALKVLRHDRAQDSPDAGKAIERFRHELQVLQETKHPCILKVLDANVLDEDPWVVTEFMPLGSLHRVLNAMSGDTWRTLRLSRDIASALAETHSRGVIHRDVKPQNIFLRTLDHAVLGDFGIAHISDATQLTATEENVGAQWFRPPEAENGRIDDPHPNFDVYSLGKVIYTCLSGGGRFKREAFREDKASLVSLFQRPDLENVNRLLDEMVVYDPAKRLQKMDEVIYRIDETLTEGVRPPVRPRVSARVGTQAGQTPPDEQASDRE